jgi:hypothetical protein
MNFTLAYCVSYYMSPRQLSATFLSARDYVMNTSKENIACASSFDIEDGSSSYFLYKIWSFHCDDYEEWRHLGCYALWLL